MKKNFKQIMQIAAVFIGTIVGAGLASGQEITQFFTTYGFKSFFGILLCLLIYIIVCPIISSISIKYNLNSYDQLISLVSPGFLGIVTDLVTGFFLISSSAIILAGSGALLHQYFGVSKYVGMALMIILSFYTLLKNTEGLVAINSIIVPALIIIIISIFLLYIFFFGKYMTLENIFSLKATKPLLFNNQWFISALLYAGFNILSCSGVLVPLSKEIQNKRNMRIGIILGAIGLNIICLMINLMLGLNTPNIFKYEIPLLYIASPFGIIVQGILLCIIFCEMLSTEVSDIYSVAKTLEQKYNLNYEKGISYVMAVAIPISQLGFKNLINILYPAFGAISLLFIIQCILFKIKKESKR